MTRLSTPITDDDHRLGDPDAAVTLVEYGDYECPFCAAAHPITQGLLRTFDPDLLYVYRHFPLGEAHPHAPAAAQAAEFASDHELFWEMHHALFVNQPRLSGPVICAIGSALGLSEAELRNALEEGLYADKVRQDFMGGVRSGVNGTPCFFINGERHEGGWSFDELSFVIQAARGDRSGASERPAPQARP